VRFFGDIRIENAGMSNVKSFENKDRRKPKVFYTNVRQCRTYAVSKLCSENYR